MRIMIVKGGGYTEEGILPYYEYLKQHFEGITYSDGEKEEEKDDYEGERMIVNLNWEQVGRMVELLKEHGELNKYFGVVVIRYDEDEEENEFMIIEIYDGYRE